MNLTFAYGAMTTELMNLCSMTILIMIGPWFTLWTYVTFYGPYLRPLWSWHMFGGPILGHVSMDYGPWTNC